MIAAKKGKKFPANIFPKILFLSYHMVLIEKYHLDFDFLPNYLSYVGTLHYIEVQILMDYLRFFGI